MLLRRIKPNIDMHPHGGALLSRFFPEMSEERNFRSVPALVTSIKDYIGKHNENHKAFIWTAKAYNILEKVKRARGSLRNG